MYDPGGLAIGSWIVRMKFGHPGRLGANMQSWFVPAYGRLNSSWAVVSVARRG